MQKIFWIYLILRVFLPGLFKIFWPDLYPEIWVSDFQSPAKGQNWGHSVGKIPTSHTYISVDKILSQIVNDNIFFGKVRNYKFKILYQ